MARRRGKEPGSTIVTQIADYHHGTEKRKNIPPAGLVAQGKLKAIPPTRYSYDPHLPPTLRFDTSGEADQLSELLEAALDRSLNREEVSLLAEALHNYQPWLEWAGKREKRWLEVDPVALHIHERVSAHAIIKLAQRQPIQRELFGDPQLEYWQAVEFYQTEVEWSNRLILGDSLTVMNSLAKREDLVGKVQMIYIDPPYGIKFASNFQPLVNRREVSEKDEDLTREPEQIRAYRDTWTLGIHSYLAYLRDRLVTARELLQDTGSIFVQISDENLHRVRMVMDEVFKPENFMSLITFVKTGGFSSKAIKGVSDYIIWYAKDAESVKLYPLYSIKGQIGRGSEKYNQVELPNGYRGTFASAGLDLDKELPNGVRQFREDNATSQGNPIHPVVVDGKTYEQPWKTNPEGILRLSKADRLIPQGDKVGYIRYLDDFNAIEMTNVWSNIGGIQSRADPKIYAVQTSTEAIKRCMLMTTKPGDLVLDPTCGSGTTAYVAEQWGRRWITVDTSRVAIALARQRILTAKFDYFELADKQKGLSENFIYKTTPHVTLKFIAQNKALDPIFAKWEPVLAEKLATLNAALSEITPEIRYKLQAKFVEKERREGKWAFTDADKRRWLVPKERWKEWEIPFDSDPDWPQSLQDALLDYRQSWRKKMDEVIATIRAGAEPVKLVDQPKIVPGILRVSGPFTVEGVQPVEESLDVEGPQRDEPGDELGTLPATDPMEEPANAEAYIEQMIRLMKSGSIRYPNSELLKFERLEPLVHSTLHAEGDWISDKGTRRVAVSIGPQYGPITALQVEESLRAAYRSAYDDLIFAGFTIDGAAQAIVQADPNPKVHCHLVYISPDVIMGDLLKNTSSSQLFTASGLPRARLERSEEGEWIVVMEGVDVYDPKSNTLLATNADKVAAWFVDGDYDGRTFFITQAFFPDYRVWEKLVRALKLVVEPEMFKKFSGTRSLPFPVGKYRRAAVKVIDPRGNEVIKLLSLGED